jgi:hypothetical protein
LTIVGGDAAAIAGAKSPSVQGADDFVTFECTKRGEVGFAMRAIPLKSKFADLNFFTWRRLCP